ncbi:MAG: rane protein [Brevibacillus sp.]|nr:rane protein [Brevibacillus sp.]
MLAGIGSFTYLYVSNISYAQRAKKLFFVMVGLSLAVGLGTLVAPHPLTSAFLVGLIGALVTFLFGAYKIQGPAAIFFVLAFSLSTGMPLDPSVAPLRAGLVLLGGALAWILGMMGWVSNSHGPETTAVSRVYHELAAYIDSVGSGKAQKGRQELVPVLKSAEETLSAGQVPWQSSGQYQRLLLLNDQANVIFLDVLEYSEKTGDRLPPQIGRSVRSIAGFLNEKSKRKEWQIRLEETEKEDKTIQRLQAKVRKAIDILSDPITSMEPAQNGRRPSLWSVLGGSFDKNSIVFLTSIRYGLVLAVAAIVAYSFELNRSYWVTLSCAAVLSGATIIATFHRAIQRSIGTVVGIMVATILLAAHPHGLIIAVLIMLLTALTELAIVLNYGLAAFFITPNALILADSMGQNHSISFFASARITDVVIGCVIGLVGTLLIGRRKASSLLPHLTAKTIRSQQQFLLTLFSDQRKNLDLKQSLGQRKMQTNLSNLKIVYTTATGEIPSNKTKLEYMWPVIYSIEQIGYLLESCLKSSRCPILPDATLSQLLLVFENMAKSAEQTRPLRKKRIPDISGFPHLEKEIGELQDALHMSNQA